MEKYSKQKELVLDILKKSYSHPTAEDVYLEAKSLNSTASKGTIYRNLNLLVEKGIIIKIPIKDGPDRFDYMKSEHHHLICDYCGEVYDFEYKLDFEKIKKKIMKDTRFKNISSSIILTGICEKCQKLKTVN